MRKAFKFFFNSMLILAGLFWLSSCSMFNEPPYQSDTMTSVIIKDSHINEASGITRSRRDNNVLWVNNDSGNAAEIYAINPQGERLATVTIPDIDLEWLDWEDMASFEMDGKAYLMIADVGDNFESHWQYHLYFIEEPDLSQYQKGEKFELKPEWVMRFMYEDGPRDCEAVAVDEKHGKILLLTKRNDPPVLYRLPLKKIRATKAKRMGEVKPMPMPKERHYRIVDFLDYTKMPTAMDIAPDGSGIVVLTYGNAFYFPTNGVEDDWLSVLNSTPKTIELPPLKQAEAIGFDHSGQHVFVTGERRPTPLLNINISSLVDTASDK